MKIVYKMALVVMPMFAFSTAMVHAPAKAAEAAKKEVAERYLMRDFDADKFVGAYGNASGTVGQSNEKGTVLDVQYGGVNKQNWFGGVWFNLTPPKKEVADRADTFGLSVKGDGTVPQKLILFITEKGGAKYVSKNVNAAWEDDEWHDLLLKPTDFSLEDEWKKKNAAAAETQSKTPNWDLVSRIDINVLGPVLDSTSKGSVSAPFLELKKK